MEEVISLLDMQAVVVVEVINSSKCMEPGQPIPSITFMLKMNPLSPSWIRKPESHVVEEVQCRGAEEVPALAAGEAALEVLEVGVLVAVAQELVGILLLEDVEQEGRSWVEEGAVEVGGTGIRSVSRTVQFDQDVC